MNLCSDYLCIASRLSVEKCAVPHNVLEKRIQAKLQKFVANFIKRNIYIYI